MVRQNQKGLEKETECVIDKDVVLESEKEAECQHRERCGQHTSGACWRGR